MHHGAGRGGGEKCSDSGSILKVNPTRLAGGGSVVGVRERGELSVDPTVWGLGRDSIT